ncbi:MAG: hypothetical protein WBD40_11220 [Tepidisphaeraceae bacterium]
MADMPASPQPTPTPAPATTPPPAGASATPPPPRKKRGLLKWTLLSLLVIILGGGALLYINLNRIVRATVEKQSAASLNVPTTLGGANVSLFGGRVSLSDFTVGSPAGFNAERMLSLGEISVGTKLSELRNEPIRIQTIDVVRPRMTLEMQGTQFNVKKFIDALPPTDPSETMKLVIDNLKVSGAEVVFKPDPSALASLGIKPESLNLKPEYILQIPNIEMNNIGTGEGAQNGAAVKEVVTLLVTSMASKATASEQIPPELRAILKGNVSDMVNVAKAKLGEEMNKQVGKITEDLKSKLGSELGGTVGEALKDPNKLKEDPGKAIQEGLGGLLNREKGGATTQPKSSSDTQKKIEQGLGGLLNRKKETPVTQPK